MRKFDPNQFYVREEDTSIRGGASNLVIQPNIDGMKLLVKYYEKKYRCQISLPIDTDLSVFAEKIKDWIAKLPNTGAQYRHAFLLGMDGPHATPIIYLKENEHQGILFADSLGKYEDKTKEIFQKIGVDVYIIDLIRQADLLSCYTDALVFCRDATAMNSENNEYYIPNLLSTLRSRSREMDGYFVAKLPDELLKTAQLSYFVAKNRETDAGKVIHKKETLDQFRERYTDKGVKKRFFGQPTDIANYVRKKGIKLADTIEIQFYLNELEQNTGVILTESLRKSFITGAKAILKNQGNPPLRSGLHQYALGFIEKINSSDLISPEMRIERAILAISSRKLIFAVENALKNYIATNEKIELGLWRTFNRKGLREAIKELDNLNAASFENKISTAREIACRILSQGCEIKSGKIELKNHRSRVDFLLRELKYNELLTNDQLGGFDLPDTIIPKNTQPKNSR